MAAELIDDLAALRAHRRTKWREAGEGVLAAGVAEMDVVLAAPVRAALTAAIERDDLGYPASDDVTGVPEAFVEWADRRWAWHPDPGRVLLVPDILRGLAGAVAAFTQPGDGVLLQTPIYPPFLELVPGLGRRLVENPLAPDGSVDVDHLGAVCAAERPRLLLLCNPHNPTGRVLRRAELEAVAAAAAAHEAVIVADEVHADLVYEPHVHIPMETVAPDRTITLQSPSKAFNLAGLRLAVAASGTAALHERMAALPSVHREGVGILAIEALLAAWTPAGEEWLASLLPQLAANRDRVADALAAFPVDVRTPEATYLAWLDCRRLGIDDPWRAMVSAGAGVSDGRRFGAPGEGFVRLNFGTGPRILDALLDRVRTVAQA